MSERRIIRAKRPEQIEEVNNREKTENEKRFAAHVQRMKSERENKGNRSELTPNPVRSEAETMNSSIPSQSKTQDELIMSAEQTLPPTRRPRFEEVHDRVTTYLSKENHRKIKKLKEEYGIPVSETINQALQEYFQRKTW